MMALVPHAAPTLQMITPSDHACHVSIGSCPTVSANTHAANTPAANSSQIMASGYRTEAAFG
jgi:hypothetical protein